MNQPPAPDARAIAHQILGRIFDKSQSLEEAWEDTKGVARLEGRDRAHCRLLLLTSLRQWGYLTAQIAAFAKQPENLPLEVRHALLLGAAQMLCLGTPAHAVVSTSVNLLARKHVGLRGVVNAVLRNLARKNEGAEKSQTHAADHWQQNIPAWLLAGWHGAYGAMAEAIARACLQEAPLDITVKENPGFWAEKLGATLLPGGSLRVQPAPENITSLPGFAEGAWWVQDAAASLPVQLLKPYITGKTVLDLCAAPGGKTAQLAGCGAKVIAVDSSVKRLERLRQNLARLQLNVDIITADILHYQPPEKIDAVLLDAPCSATGTLRRHPDLMHHKTPATITRLAAQQRHMLQHCSHFVKPGGMLLYTVCSLEPQEGEAVVAAFLAANPLWQRQPVLPGEMPPAWISGAGDLRTLPCYLGELGGMDGFYAARLVLAAGC